MFRQLINRPARLPSKMAADWCGDLLSTDTEGDSFAYTQWTKVTQSRCKYTPHSDEKLNPTKKNSLNLTHSTRMELTRTTVCENRVARDESVSHRPNFTHRSPLVLAEKKNLNNNLRSRDHQRQYCDTAAPN